MKHISDTTIKNDGWDISGLLSQSNNPELLGYCLNYTVKKLPTSTISVHDGMIIPIMVGIFNFKNLRFKSDIRNMVNDVMINYPRLRLKNKGVINNLMDDDVEWLDKTIQLFIKEYLYL
jgi:hypothetical protein